MKQTSEIYETEFFILIPHLLSLAIHFSPLQLTASLLKGVSSFWRTPEMHHRGKDVGTTERHQWCRPEGRLDTATFYSSELIVLGEKKAALSTGSEHSSKHTFKKKILLSTEDLLGYGSSDLILEWANIHLCIHSTAWFFPLHFNEKVPLSLKGGNSGLRRVLQKLQCPA